MENLNGRVAVVTGGAAGVGRGIANVLAAEGAAVAIADIDGDHARIVADELRAAGRRAIAVATDVADRGSTDRMAAEVLREFGRIDILAANAGIFPQTEFARIDDAVWDRVMGINVKGALHAAQACLPGMLAAGFGRIVVTSSITGPITGQAGFAHYGASKAALLGLVRSLAVDVAEKGVTVNAVLPGNVRTEGFVALPQDHKDRMLASIPMRYLAEPVDVGWAVRFLASAEARYITGQTLVVDGGQVLPE